MRWVAKIFNNLYISKHTAYRIFNSALGNWTMTVDSRWQINLTSNIRRRWQRTLAGTACRMLISSTTEVLKPRQGHCRPHAEGIMRAGKRSQSLPRHTSHNTHFRHAIKTSTQINCARLFWILYINTIQFHTSQFIVYPYALMEWSLCPLECLILMVTNTNCGRKNNTYTIDVTMQVI